MMKRGRRQLMMSVLPQPLDDWPEITVANLRLNKISADGV